MLVEHENIHPTSQVVYQPINRRNLWSITFINIDKPPPYLYALSNQLIKHFSVVRGVLSDIKTLQVTYEYYLINYQHSN